MLFRSAEQADRWPESAAAEAEPDMADLSKELRRIELSERAEDTQATQQAQQAQESQADQAELAGAEQAEQAEQADRWILKGADAVDAALEDSAAFAAAAAAAAEGEVDADADADADGAALSPPGGAWMLLTGAMGAAERNACPQGQRNADDKECLAAVKEAMGAKLAGFHEIIGLKAVHDGPATGVPKGCSYSETSKTALYNYNKEIGRAHV